MARLQLGAFTKIAGGIVGTAMVLGPSIGSAVESDVVKVLNRIESQRRATLVRERTKRVEQEKHWATGSTKSTAIERLGGGLAAGDGSSGLSTWGDVSYIFSEDNKRLFNSDLVSWSMGADGPVLGDDLTLGGFASFAYTDSSGTGKSETNGFSFGPYGSYAFTDFLNLDASLGGAFDSTDAVGGPKNEQESKSFFTSSNLNAQHWIGNFGARGRVGVVYSDASIDENTPDVEFGQFQAGAELSYYASDVAGLQALPYVKFDFNEDFKGNPPGDDEEFILGAGVNVFSEGSLSGSFDYSTVLGRSQFFSHGFAATLTYRF